jgi:glycosyltransferase involved in cell wall biosynthesis
MMSTLGKRIRNYISYHSRKVRIRCLVIGSVIRWGVFRITSFLKFNKSIEEKLVVSMTTTPKRIEYLKKTLKTVITQSVSAAEIAIYIESDHIDLLEEIAREFAVFNVKVHPSHEKLRAGTKLIPELARDTGREIILILDDDVIYPHNLIKSMLRTLHNNGGSVVVCNWAQTCGVDVTGKPQHYRDWREIRNTGELSANAMPLGVAGVMAARSTFPRQIRDTDVFRDVCDCIDDLWYWCHFALSDTRVVMNETLMRVPITWPGSQDSALWRTENKIDGPKDVAFRKLLNEYPEFWEKIYGTTN